MLMNLNTVRTVDLKKAVIVVLIIYICLHLFLFFKNLNDVNLERRKFNAGELHDGPLVLHDGLSAWGHNPLSKVARPKIYEGLGPIEFHPPPQVPNGKAPDLDKPFVESLIEKAIQVSENGTEMIFFTFVNSAYEKLTTNWLCNTAVFPKVHDRLLVVTTNNAVCTGIDAEWGESVACLHLKIQGYDEAFSWGVQKYINMLTIRLRLMVELNKNLIPFVLVETDSTWFKNPIPLFENRTIVEDADIIVPVKGYTVKGDALSFDPMVVLPTDGARTLLVEMEKRLINNSKAYDQDVLNDLCSAQFNGVVCRTFEWTEIADGKWFKMSEKERTYFQPYIVNNNYYVGVKSKEARQAIAGLWFLSRGDHCVKAKVKKSIVKYIGEIGSKNKTVFELD